MPDEGKRHAPAGMCCSQCFYWDGKGRRVSIENICRLYPPPGETSQAYASNWTKTRPDDWCSGFEHYSVKRDA